jgi:hypothetical protein
VSTVEEIRTAIPKLSVEELRDRERDIESGKSKFIDWEKAKADIRRQTS